MMCHPISVKRPAGCSVCWQPDDGIALRFGTLLPHQRWADAPLWSPVLK